MAWIFVQIIAWFIQHVNLYIQICMMKKIFLNVKRSNTVNSIIFNFNKVCLHALQYLFLLEIKYLINYSTFIQIQFPSRYSKKEDLKKNVLFFNFQE